LLSIARSVGLVVVGLVVAVAAAAEIEVTHRTHQLKLGLDWQTLDQDADVVVAAALLGS
jgi:hypothetical protein